MSINAANSGFSNTPGGTGGGGGGNLFGSGTYPRLAMWLASNTLGDSGAEYDPNTGFFSLNKPVSTNLFGIEFLTNNLDSYFLLKNNFFDIVVLRDSNLMISSNFFGGVDFKNSLNSNNSLFGLNIFMSYFSDFYGSNILIGNNCMVFLQTEYNIFGVRNIITTTAYFSSPILIFGAENSVSYTGSSSIDDLLNIFGRLNSIYFTAVYQRLNLLIYGHNNTIQNYPEATIYGKSISIYGSYSFSPSFILYLSYGANHSSFNNTNYLSESIINFGNGINIFGNNEYLNLYLTQSLLSISFGSGLTLSYNNFYRLYFASFGNSNIMSSNEFTLQDLTIGLFGINNYFNSNTSISFIYFRYTIFGLFNQVFNNQLGENIVIFGYKNEILNSTVNYPLSIFGIFNQIFGINNIGEVVITGQYNFIGNNSVISNTSFSTVSIYGLRNNLDTLNTTNINSVLLFTNYFILFQSNITNFTAIGSYMSVGSNSNLNGLFVFGYNISIQNMNLNNIFIFKNNANSLLVISPPYNIPDNSYVFIDYNTGQPSFCITPNNRVGIGNSSISAFPQEQLTVEGRIRSVSSDIVVETNTRGFILKAPNGNYWRIQVDNSGVLTTTNLGSILPSEF